MPHRNVIAWMIAGKMIIGRQIITSIWYFKPSCTKPDEPQIQGYTSMRREDSNSLLDMGRHAYAEAINSARVEGAREAKEGCVANTAMDLDSTRHNK